jgi:hypothetical protein
VSNVVRVIPAEPAHGRRDGRLRLVPSRDDGLGCFADLGGRRLPE